jgi:hypothetical protein
MSVLPVLGFEKVPEESVVPFKSFRPSKLEKLSFLKENLP